ncbi:putative uncharacterized protein DDB_G0282499 [Myzus persicae]|uniref:putative uncharacterized protein DDB_G0282499 n=1 Tax=Myzus persicae TaxID=13164 RepID=UPI000B937FA3|nr:putative uncharacterized protein DDB_G0282499 [Myzus persicae]
MKSSLVIASVLLAGVALGVNAYRINNNNNNNNQDEIHNQWFRFQQTDSSDESLNLGTMLFEQKTDDSKINNNNDQLNKRIMNNDDSSESTFSNHKFQNHQHDETHFSSNENLTQRQRQQQQQQQQPQQQQYLSQNRATSGQSSNGLTKKITDKIAAIHQIARNIKNFNGALDVARDSVKLSANNFVTFYNSTMNNLNSGELKYMYLNPETDTVVAQCHFNHLETVGSFKSDVQDARSGYYTIIMNNVNSNLSTGFYDDRHSVVRPAKFQYADANIKTQDGSTTQAFDSALKRFLGVLATAVSKEVKMYTRNTVLVQIKNEIVKPIVLQNTENNKLFDLMWQEGNVAMEMPNIGYQNLQLDSATEQLFKSMTFQSKSQNSYTTSYDFALNNLEWTSTMTVTSAGKRTAIPLTKFNVEKIDIQANFNKLSFDKQQSCDDITVNVNVRGLNYDLDDNLLSEVVSEIDNNLQRFIQHNLESNIQTALKQIFCNNHYNKY